jgi:hypothetical protein
MHHCEASSERVIRQVSPGSPENDAISGGAAEQRLTALLVLDGSMNSEVFLAFVEQVLAPHCGEATWS